MTKDEFLVALQKEVEGYNRIIATEKGEWIVKGFIDIYKQIYAITLDTKVISKVLELLLIPAFHSFAGKNNLTLELPPYQNFYPDLSFLDNETGDKFAVDIKSTYRDSKNVIGSMTLGAFTGYFRNRESCKNTLYPYGTYKAHIVLGVIYSQIELKPEERKIYKLDDLDKIESVIRDFQFFVQPKYKIAVDKPGSGNTKNIGAVNNIEKLINGQGIFATLGEEVYDDYWMFYLTRDMAKALEIPRPYTNIKSYMEYKRKGVGVLEKHKQEIIKFAEETAPTEENGENGDNGSVEETNGENNA
jgi:hypothetical protein